jgi:serine/threonine protein phosphatase PrpC
MTASVKDLLFGSHSHRGPRETNQDTVLSIAIADHRWLVAVADGMGGLAKGELASKTALGALYQHLSDGAGLVTAIMEANAAVHEEAKGQKIGTTLVAALLTGNVAEVANVGDSRAYLFDSLGLLQVTQDHTMGEEAVRDGSINASQLASSPWAGALSRYLGADEGVVVDHFGPFEIHEGGRLLLCSDGLHRVFSTDEMEAFLSKVSNPEEGARRLVEEALERNTEDNVSVALVFRPGGNRATAPSAGSPKRPSPWNPESLLIKPRRLRPRKKSRKSLAIIFFLVVIPLLIGIVMVLRRWFSAGAG